MRDLEYGAISIHDDSRFEHRKCEYDLTAHAPRLHLAGGLLRLQLRWRRQWMLVVKGYRAFPLARKRGHAPLRHRLVQIGARSAFHIGEEFAPRRDLAHRKGGPHAG